MTAARRASTARLEVLRERDSARWLIALLVTLDSISRLGHNAFT
jgi:hypothetical protein